MSKPVLKNKPRTHFKYRCRVCGWSCTKESIPGTGVPVTKTGDYGSAGGPGSEEFADEMYEAATISFTAAAGDEPAKIADSASRFGEKGFRSELPLRIETTSGTNDGDYTIAARGVTRGEIRLDSSDSLTTEDAATAGTVTLSRIWQKQKLTTGCPSCGSLWSR